jgi:uncharacterized membrane protein YfcA
MIVPMMALTVTVPQAAAVLMPILLVMDLMGLRVFIKEYNRDLARLLIPAGLWGTLIGWTLFGLMPSSMVAGLVGVFTLAFLAQRLYVERHPEAYRPLKPFWGRILGTMGGVSSFIAHAGSPPLNAYVIPLRLKPREFTATLNIFYVVINLSKWIPYGFLGLIDARNMLTSLVLMPIAPIGIWIGVRVVRRIPERRFYSIVYTGMLLTGIKLVWDALVAL